VFDPITGRGAIVGGGGGGGRIGRAISASNLHKKQKVKSQSVKMFCLIKSQENAYRECLVCGN